MSKRLSNESGKSLNNKKLKTEKKNNQQTEALEKSDINQDYLSEVYNNQELINKDDNNLGRENILNSNQNEVELNFNFKDFLENFSKIEREFEKEFEKDNIERNEIIDDFRDLEEKFINIEERIKNNNKLKSQFIKSPLYKNFKDSFSVFQENFIEQFPEVSNFLYYSQDNNLMNIQKLNKVENILENSQNNKQKQNLFKNNNDSFFFNQEEGLNEIPNIIKNDLEEFLKTQKRLNDRIDGYIENVKRAKKQAAKLKEDMEEFLSWFEDPKNFIENLTHKIEEVSEKIKKNDEKIKKINDIELKVKKGENLSKEDEEFLNELGPNEKFNLKDSARFIKDLDSTKHELEKENDGLKSSKAELEKELKDFSSKSLIEQKEYLVSLKDKIQDGIDKLTNFQDNLNKQNDLNNLKFDKGFNLNEMSNKESFINSFNQGNLEQKLNDFKKESELDKDHKVERNDKYESNRGFNGNTEDLKANKNKDSKDKIEDLKISKPQKRNLEKISDDLKGSITEEKSLERSENSQTKRGVNEASKDSFIDEKPGKFSKMIKEEREKKEGGLEKY